MSTGSSTKAATASAKTRRRRGLPRLRDLRIRTKLALILFVPLLAILLLGVIRLADLGGRALDARQVEGLAMLSTDVTELTAVLHEERMAAGAYLAGTAPDVELYTAAIAKTNIWVRQYTERRRLLDDDPPRLVAARLSRIDDVLSTLEATRGPIKVKSGISATDAVLRYGVVAADLVGYGDALGRLAGDGEVGDRLRAVAAFSRAKAGAADAEALAYAAASTGTSGPEQQAAFIVTQAAQQEALLAFTAVATPADRTLVERAVAGDAVDRADRVARRLSRDQRVEPAEITQAFGAVVDLMRGAERRLEGQAVDATHAASSSVTRQAVLESGLAVLVLFCAIALAVVLARSLNESLRRLRQGALGVAERDLPNAVARLRDAREVADSEALDIVRRVRDPIRLDQRDEVGQVASAFNMVHREAVRIAAEQAALRTSVSAMFLNLARRSQALVDRMIGELDDIERGEEDPKRLARLFDLDHLATRMRRNDENLLILAGADSSTPRREDALLVDALRAAQSEVEQYDRIEFGTVDTGIAVAAAAVNDVVRLVAELLDNATRFSAPTTMVVADGHRSGDQVLIRIEDRGLGISADQRELLNHRLADPKSAAATFRLMGLAVVGRLAWRYAIRVELKAGPGGGTVAEVTLPGGLIVPDDRPDARPHATRVPLGRPAPAVPAAAFAPLPETPERTVPASFERTHPSLPLMPSQRPPATGVPQQRPPSDPPLQTEPTPGRPPLPSRAARAKNAAPRSAEPAHGWGAALAAMPAAPEPPPPVAPAREGGEAPIFQQIQATWFGDENMPSAGQAPPPQRAPEASPVPGEWRTPTPAHSEPTAVDDRWRTVADDGWVRAQAAAEPQDGGVTRSGLRRRVPQAQLVPGSVQTGPHKNARRSPDDVRGLLSAYHRGVHRGRAAGDAESATGTPAPKENRQ